MELEKMKLASASGSELNLEALYQIMPSAFTEVRDEKTGEITHKINFSTLRELLGDNAYDEADEEYGFKWVGKNAARREAARSINKTLRPCPEESVDWENTQNLYIEGDNLEVLKLLQKSYLGKIKMIYIDPPYNTGNDFVYRDDFAQDKDGYEVAAGNIDELGNRFRKNADTNARFHSDWCSMIYERLLVARSLLSNDGVIFVSIDDNEVDNLRKICDEVFGEHNFISSLIWAAGRKNDSKYISVSHEYMLCYVKNISILNERKTIWRERKQGIDDIYLAHKRIIKEWKDDYKGATTALKQWYKGLPDTHPAKNHSHYSCIDERGVYFPSDISWPGGGGPKYEVLHPVTHKPVKVPNRGWVFPTPARMEEMISLGLVHFGDDENSVPCKKTYLKDGEYETPYSVFYRDGRASTKRLRGLMDAMVFQNPKDETIIQNLIEFTLSNNDALILDFFSGSATTAYAVMQLNAEDGGNRRYIMVQLPEDTEAGSEAYKAGYKNICEIGKERIRRAGRKIKEEAGEKAATLDTGFRVFKCEDSFMNDVYFSPAELQQQDLFAQVSNIKDGTSDLSMLFGCMLDWGVQLSLPLSTFEVAGKTIYNVNDGDLVACFNENVNEDAISAIAELNPLRVVFRDSCFGDAPLKMNLFELFKQKCGWSEEVVRSRVHVI